MQRNEAPIIISFIIPTTTNRNTNPTPQQQQQQRSPRTLDAALVPLQARGPAAGARHVEELEHAVLAGVLGRQLPLRAVDPHVLELVAGPVCGVRACVVCGVCVSPQSCSTTRSL